MEKNRKRPVGVEEEFDKEGALKVPTCEHLSDAQRAILECFEAMTQTQVQGMALTGFHAISALQAGVPDWKALYLSRYRFRELVSFDLETLNHPIGRLKSLLSILRGYRMESDDYTDEEDALLEALDPWIEKLEEISEDLWKNYAIIYNPNVRQEISEEAGECIPESAMTRKTSLNPRPEAA